MPENKKLSFLRKLTIVIIWLVLWQILYFFVDNNLLLSSPLQISKRLFEMIQEKTFWFNTFSSIYRILCGFFLAMISGIVLSILTTNSRILHEFLSPILSTIKATPVASFIILALVWIKHDSNVPIFISFLMVLPTFWINISEGIRKTDKNLLEMARIFNFSKLKTFRLIYIPSVFPYFMAAFTVSLGMAWKSGVAAEVLSTPKFSIGSRLHDAKVYLETVDLFVWTIVIIILSIIIEFLLIRLLKYISSKLKLGGNNL